MPGLPYLTGGSPFETTLRRCVAEPCVDVDRPQPATLTDESPAAQSRQTLITRLNVDRSAKGREC